MRLPAGAIFDSSQLSANLATKSVRSGMSNMSAQVAQFVFQIAGTVVLARLLTPSDYGLIGMVAVVVGFAAMFKEFGLSAATVQKDDISPGQISSLFWVNFGVSLLLTVSVLAAAPFVAAFYGHPELVAVTAALSFSLIISGVTVQHAALLRRHMRFTSLALVSVVSQLLSTAVAVGLALAGCRYWALVGGTLASAEIDAPEFRRQVVGLVRSGRPLAEATADVGVSEATLSRWIIGRGLLGPHADRTAESQEVEDEG